MVCSWSCVAGVPSTACPGLVLAADATAGQGLPREAPLPFVSRAVYALPVLSVWPFAYCVQCVFAVLCARAFAVLFTLVLLLVSSATYLAFPFTDPVNRSQTVLGAWTVAGGATLLLVAYAAAVHALYRVGRSGGYSAREPRCAAGWLPRALRCPRRCMHGPRWTSMLIQTTRWRASRSWAHQPQHPPRRRRCLRSCSRPARAARPHARRAVPQQPLAMGTCRCGR